MMTTQDPRQKLAPIEVWLTKANIEVRCLVVHEDERTEQLDIAALTMRGAQREITGYLIGAGYTPVGRWEPAADEREVSRKFKPGHRAPGTVGHPSHR